MKIAQYVMAYEVEQDRLRAILPDGFLSLRPVLRINGEIRDGGSSYLELNTAVEIKGKKNWKGWLNIGYWNEASFQKEKSEVRFQTEFLEISFTRTGLEGNCPAEKDNEGCYFLDREISLRVPEVILEHKEFCDCRFSWNFSGQGACGVSMGKTLPAIPTEQRTAYPKQNFSVKNAALIPCKQVLGAYVVEFTRTR